MSIPIIHDTSQARTIIESGRVLAFPTSTSYGLAVDALQGWALQRLRNLKSRHEHKTFTVFLEDGLVSNFFDCNPLEEKILKTFNNHPLTILLKPRHQLAHLTQDGLVGLRLIDHPAMRDLARAIPRPLTATSANKSGVEPCYDSACIRQTFPYLISDDLLTEDNPRGASGTTYDLSLGAIFSNVSLQKGEPSTIIKISNQSFKIIRPGSVTKSDLEAQLS